MSSTGASSDEATRVNPVDGRGPVMLAPARGAGPRASRARQKALWHVALGLSACGITILVGAVVLRAREAPRTPAGSVALAAIVDGEGRGGVRAAGGERADDRREGSMTRDEALRLARSYSEAQGIKNSPGLNDKNLGGVESGGQTLYYEYQPDGKRLECGALIYRFNKPPRDKVLEGFKAEEAAGTDTGGGSLHYEPQNHGLFLRRIYHSAVPAAQFNKDMDRLRKAAAIWADQVLDRVATKAFG